jgi:hypothetical protein
MDAQQHSELDAKITNHTKVIAISKGVVIVSLVAAVLLTCIATFLILLANDRTAQVVLDCVVPTGDCYQNKVRDVSSFSDAEVDLIVYTCVHNTKPANDKADVAAARLCIQRELLKR